MTSYNQIAKQVIDFQQNSFSSIFNAMATLQDQAANTVDTVLNQTTWMPDDGRKVIREWVDACQEERDRFKSYVDDGFSGLQKYFGNIKTTGSAKAKK